MFDAFDQDYPRHARESAYNAYYDRPAVLGALGPVDGLRLLDAGCGPGLYAAEVVARGAAFVQGIDISPEMIRLAEEAVRGPVAFRVHDLAQPLAWLEAASFDAAVMALVIHHSTTGSGPCRRSPGYYGRAAAWLCRRTIPQATGSAAEGAISRWRRSTETWSRGWQVAYWRQPLEVTCQEFAAGGFLIEQLHNRVPPSCCGSATPRSPRSSHSNPASSSSGCARPDPVQPGAG
jgi:SAM-dependent methyltransferase